MKMSVLLFFILQMWWWWRGKRCYRYTNSEKREEAVWKATKKNKERDWTSGSKRDWGKKSAKWI